MSENSIQDINEYNTEIDTMNLWCEKSLVTETPTVFELTGTTPITDPFGGVLGYNSLARRSENQVIGL